MDTSAIETESDTPTGVKQSSSTAPVKSATASSDTEDTTGSSVPLLDPEKDTGPPLRVLLPPINTSSNSTDDSRNSTDNKNFADTRGSTSPFLLDYRGFERTFYAGLRWNGGIVGVRDNPYSMELKYFEDTEDITSLGLRVSYHVLRLGESNIYGGIDFAKVSYERGDFQSDGNSAGFFVGLEKRLGNRFTWTLDVGPNYIFLTDNPDDRSFDKLEYPLTTGINFAF